MNGDQSNRRTFLLNGTALVLVTPLASCVYRPPPPSTKPCEYFPATDAWNCPVVNLPPLGAETKDLSGEHDWAARALGAAICAYNIPPDESCFDATYWDPIGAKGQAIVVAGGEECIDAAFVAATTDDWVVLSLRGTIGDYTSLHGLFSFIDDWWEDDESRLCLFDPMLGGTPSDEYGKVHYGFQRAMRHLWPKIKAALESPEIDLANKKGIQITGHSKGAALTFLAAMLVSLHFPNVKKIGVHAFAAPQAGDADFARAYNEKKPRQAHYPLSARA